MIASVLSAALQGVDAFGVEVEVHIGNGIPPGLKTVGLAEGAVRESQERVKPAVINSGFQFPNRKVTINLAPADMRKDGSAFDLPIALSLLGATGRLSSRERLRRYLVIGELALDGRVRGIKGALSTALLARAAKYDGLVLPRENAMEAAVVGVTVGAAVVVVAGGAVPSMAWTRAATVEAPGLGSAMLAGPNPMVRS